MDRIRNVEGMKATWGKTHYGQINLQGHYYHMLRTHRRCYGSERVKDRYRKKYTEPGQGSEDDGQKGQEGINREPSCKGRRG